MEKERIAVMYVDFDDDLGRVGIETPVVGEEKAREAISRFMEYRPEDSDLNTMIVALNVYNELKQKGYDVQIVFLSGSSEGGTLASLEFSKKLDDVIQSLRITGAYIVYDSPEDAKAIPLIQSRVKVVGIKHVVVEQSKSVEEVYALLGKYIRKIVEEPRYSRIALGVPGLILLIVGLLSLMGLGQYIAPVSALVIGVFFIVRGYNIDDVFQKWWESSALIFVSALISLSILLLGGVYSYIAVQSLFSQNLPAYVYALYYFQAFLPFLVLSAVVFLAAKSVSKLLSDEKFRVWHEVYKIIAIVFIYWALSKGFANISTNGIVNTLVEQQNSLLDLAVGAAALIFTYVVLTLAEKRIGNKEKLE